MPDAILLDATWYGLLPVFQAVNGPLADWLSAVTWTFAVLATAAVIITGWLDWRDRRRAWPDHLERLLEPPRVPGWLVPTLAVAGLLTAAAALPILGKPGVWQAHLLAAYVLGVLAMRKYHVALAAAVLWLASVAMISLPLAFASELRPPGSATALSHRQVLLLWGCSALVASVVWAVSARQWLRQRTDLGPVSTGHRMTGPAAVAAGVCLLAATICLMLAFPMSSR